MATIRPRHIDHTEGEDRLLRRLGGAVIVHWHALPTEVQDLVLRQASLMFDRNEAVRLVTALLEHQTTSGRRPDLPDSGAPQVHEALRRLIAKYAARDAEAPRAPPECGHPDFE